MQDSDQIRHLAEQLKIMGDPVRMRIVRLLASKELSVGDITKVLDLPQPTVSRKLAELRRSGILEDRRKGKKIFYKWTTKFSQSELKGVAMAAKAREFTADLKSLEDLLLKKKITL
ncbi:MAG: winged helix-turn-helix transcriptional regulator [FCB group bacterium]|nr:winged helix-turn-helix transcriptional regulator [FCB group bacterium]